LASDLHLFAAVSPTAALSGLSATAGDPQALLAPDPGSSPEAGAFREQLLDVSAVSLLPGFAGVPQVANRVSATAAPKKDAGQTDGNGAYVAVIPIPNVTRFPQPLNFALPANTTEEPAAKGESPDAPSVTDPAPPQSQGDPQPAARPVRLAQAAPLMGGSIPRQTLADVLLQAPQNSSPARAGAALPQQPPIQPQSTSRPSPQVPAATPTIVPLPLNNSGERPYENVPAMPLVRLAQVQKETSTRPQAAALPPTAPLAVNNSATAPAPVTAPQRAPVKEKFDSLKSVASDSQALSDALPAPVPQQPAVPTTPSVATQPGEGRPAGSTSESARLTAPPQVQVKENVASLQAAVLAARYRSLPVTAQLESRFQNPATPVTTRPTTTQTEAGTDAVTQPAAPAPDLTELIVTSQQLASQQPPQPERKDSPQPPLPDAGIAPTPVVVSRVRPLSGEVPRAREAAATKDDQQEVSQPPANPAPAAILRPVPLNPSLAIAPSSPVPQATQPVTQFSQFKLPPAPAGAQDPQPLPNQPDTIPQIVPVPVAQTVSGELAFAVKVTPQETAGPTTEISDGPKPMVTSSAAQVAPVKESRRAENDGTPQDGAPQHDTAHQPPLPAAALPVAEKPAVASPSVPEAHTATPQHTISAELAQLSETPEAKPLQPLKQLSIQMGQEPQQRVELRVVERAGELQVAVRTANPEVAQGLRQGISDLVGQLEQSGYHADAWRPGAAAGATQMAAEKPQTQAGPQNNNSQSQSGSQQDRQQGNQNPSRRPQWVEELETTSAGSGELIAGETYGITR